MEVGVGGEPMEIAMAIKGGDTGSVTTLILRMEGPPVWEPPVRPLDVGDMFMENNPLVIV